MATVAQVIDKARDRHAAFDRKTIPDRMARRFLSDYCRQLQGRVEAIDPGALRVEQVVPMPLGDFDAGFTLSPDVRYVAEIVAKEPATVANPRTFPVTIINVEQRNAPNGPLAAAWLVGNVLHLRSPASLWQNIGSLAVAYVPTPTELTDGTYNIPLPDAAELACVERLAEFMARRGTLDSAAPPINLDTFTSAADRAEGAYLADVANRLTGQVWFTQDTYRPS